MDFGFLIDNNFLTQFVGTFFVIAGFIIGLGAVTVIDLHGFLGRKSSYWTEATTRTHKVTKPLIWVGMILVLIGSVMVYPWFLLRWVLCVVAVLILNGFFLSFVVSPFLLKQEYEGKSDKLLPESLQRKIVISFLVSFIGWWSLVCLFALLISTKS